LRRISRGLDEGSKGFHADHGIAAADEVGGSAETSLTRSPVLPGSNQTAFSRYLTAEARGLKALLTATPAVPKGARAISWPWSQVDPPLPSCWSNGCSAVVATTVMPFGCFATRAQFSCPDTSTEATKQYPRPGMLTMNRCPSRPSRSVRRKADILTVRLLGSTKTLGQTRAIGSCLLTSSPRRSSKTIRNLHSATSERYGLAAFQQEKLRRKQAKRSE
jgi:hypothetical protein